MKLLYTDFADKATLRDLSKRYQIPGFNYCLIKEGVAQPVHAYGVQNAETGEPMLPSTIFEAASLTKTLFACLVLRLVDRGVLTLDEPIAKLAPNVQVSQDERIQTITARQVLSHGTGLPDWDKKPYLKFLFDPGTSYSYSGEGYYYLQKIVNEITGKDFTDHYWDEFLKPIPSRCGSRRSRRSRAASTTQRALCCRTADTWIWKGTRRSPTRPGRCTAGRRITQNICWRS